MPIGYHLIFGAYGFWLPNDPRGSWSKYVGSDSLAKHGHSTKTTETNSQAYVPHDRIKRVEAKKSLQRPALKFTGLQAKDIGEGFGEYARKVELPIWACAIMPDHIHLVSAVGHLSPSKLVSQLKSHATRRLMRNQRHPFANLAREGACPPQCFARGEWTVFLDDFEDIERAVKYVENNPIKEGLKLQKWPFVKPFTN